MNVNSTWFPPNSNSNIWLAKENSFSQFLSTPFGLNLGLNKVHATMVQKTYKILLLLLFYQAIFN